MTGTKPLLGGVELGGTKCICFIGTAPDDIREQVSVPTGSEPLAVLRRIIQQLTDWQSLHGRIAALGIASFGPVDLATRSSTYGFITSTSKRGWRFVDVAGHLSQAFAVPAVRWSVSSYSPHSRCGRSSPCWRAPLACTPRWVVCEP